MNVYERSYRDIECVSMLEEIQSIPGYSHSIKSLSICSDFTGSASGIFDNTDLKNLIQTCPNLEKLDLYRCLSLTEKGLKKIAKLERLTSLNLVCCIYTTDMVLLTLKGKALTRLDLSSCHNITDIGFSVIPTLKALKQLNVSFCENLSDRDLEKFSSMPLTALSIFGCNKITDQGLKYILNMKNLVELVGVSSAISLPNTSWAMRHKLSQQTIDRCF